MANQQPKSGRTWCSCISSGAAVEPAMQREAHTHAHVAPAPAAHHAPLSASLTAALKEELKHDFEQLEQQFVKYFGADAIDKLRASCNAHPVLTIGGDQLTGKSTLSQMLAEKFKGTATSAGTVFRAIAKERGLTVAQLSKLAHDEPEIDVKIDYELCRMICQGKPDGPFVIEGRQPALMATYVKQRFGKSNALRLYLSCDVRHQALRFIRREVGLEAYESARVQIPDKPYSSLADVGADVKTLQIEKVELVVSMFQDNQHRDADDQQRYLSLYGFGDKLSYQNAQLYDIIIDTTHRDIDATFAAAVEELTKRKFSEQSAKL